jgi:hypothetical protein
VEIPSVLFQDAHRNLQQFLFPLSVAEFLDKALIGSFRKIEAGGNA